MSGAVPPLPYASMEIKFGETLHVPLRNETSRQPAYNVSIPVSIFTDFQFYLQTFPCLGQRPIR